MKQRSAESRILTVLFFGPPVLVALAVFGPWRLPWLPRAEEPYGQRYEAPTPLPETALEGSPGERSGTEWARGRWSLIYAREPACDAGCLQGLEVLSEVWQALSDRGNVQRVYLSGGESGLAAGTPLAAGLVVGRLDGGAGAELRRALGEERIAGGYLYIADPNGNLRFAYPPDAEPEGITRDLKRLLALSRIL